MVKETADPFDDGMDDVIANRANQARTHSFGDTFYNNALMQQYKIEAYKPRDGDNQIIIVNPPLIRGERPYWGFLFAAHFNLGVNHSKFACPAFFNRGACPCCEERNKAKARGDEEAEGRYRYKMQAAYFVVDVFDNSPIIPANLKLWVASGYAIDDELAQKCEKKERVGGQTVLKRVNICNPNKPFALTFNKSGKGLSTRYTGIDLVAWDAYDLTPFKPIPNIEDFIVFHDYEHTDKVVRFGGAAKTGEAEEEFESNETNTDESESIAERVRGRIQS